MAIETNTRPFDNRNGNNASTHVHESSKDTNQSTNFVNPSTTTFNLHDRLTVHRSPKAFSSGAISLISLARGSLFYPLTNLSRVSGAAYTTVQVDRDAHIELNSDLVFCNHSCSPTLEFDMHANEVRVARDRDLRVGDPLTFWYPSTEWSMTQPFECSCGSSACKGWISGAGEMEEGVVRGYWLNAHIENLLDEKAGRKKKGEKK
jgi:hypothetical protein